MRWRLHRPGGPRPPSSSSHMRRKAPAALRCGKRHRQPSDAEKGTGSPHMRRKAPAAGRF
eukprot:365455-Chlamydomonas_euryale.AAC.28